MLKNSPAINELTTEQIINRTAQRPKPFKNFSHLIRLYQLSSFPFESCFFDTLIAEIGDLLIKTLIENSKSISSMISQLSKLHKEEMKRLPKAPEQAHNIISNKF